MSSTDTLDPLAGRLDNLVAGEGLAAALAVVFDDEGRPDVTCRFSHNLPVGALDRLGRGCPRRSHARHPLNRPARVTMTSANRRAWSSCHT